MSGCELTTIIEWQLRSLYDEYFLTELLCRDNACECRLTICRSGVGVCGDVRC